MDRLNERHTLCVTSTQSWLSGSHADKSCMAHITFSLQVQKLFRRYKERERERVSSSRGGYGCRQKYGLRYRIPVVQYSIIFMDFMLLLFQNSEWVFDWVLECPLVLRSVFVNGPRCNGNAMDWTTMDDAPGFNGTTRRQQIIWINARKFRIYIVMAGNDVIYASSSNDFDCSILWSDY